MYANGRLFHIRIAVIYIEHYLYLKCFISIFAYTFCDYTVIIHTRHVTCICTTSKTKKHFCYTEILYSKYKIRTFVRYCNVSSKTCITVCTDTVQ
jgi:hypothetical protein